MASAVKYSDHNNKFSEPDNYKVLDAINTLRQEVKSIQKSLALLRQGVCLKESKMTSDYQSELSELWLLHHEPNISENDIGWRDSTD